MAGHGPHGELRCSQLRGGRRPRGQHRRGVPVHLLPRGGSRGPHHHDAHGGGGACPHRHVQGAWLPSHAHRLQIPRIRSRGQRDRQHSRHPRAVPSAARRHHEGLRHHILRARAAAAAARRSWVRRACSRARRRRHAVRHLGRRRRHLARAPGAAHAAAHSEGGQAHITRTHRSAVAASLVLVESDVPQPVPLQEALRHDGHRHRGLHGALADGSRVVQRHQRYNRQAVRRDHEVQRRRYAGGRPVKRRAAAY